MLNKIRWASQTFFVGLAVFLGFRHQLLGGGPQGAPPLDAYCPFGAVEALPTLVVTGQFLEKTALSNFILFGAVALLALVLGASFCGWICPVGALQDMLAWLNRKTIKLQFTLSPKAEHYLSLLRYGVLALVICFSVKSASLWFGDYDPFKVIFHFKFETVRAIVLFIGFFVAGFFIPRFWCKFLCPLGGILSFFALVSPLKITRRAETCINCKQCDCACPVNLGISQSTDTDLLLCTKCLKCTTACPVPGTLTPNLKLPALANARVPVRQWLVPALTLTLFLAPLTGALATKQWQAFNPKVKTASAVVEVTEIKGWMKIPEVAEAFRINEKELVQALQLPTDYNRGESIKNLGTRYGFETEQVRQAVLKLKNNTKKQQP